MPSLHGSGENRSWVLSQRIRCPEWCVVVGHNSDGSCDWEVPLSEQMGVCVRAALSSRSRWCTETDSTLFWHGLLGRVLQFCKYVVSSTGLRVIDIAQAPFLSFSLIKEETNRPKYKTLLQHPFIQLHEKLQPYVHPEVASYVGKLNAPFYVNQHQLTKIFRLVNILESMANNGITQFTTDQPAIW